MSSSPSVFISYSNDSVKNGDRVLSFANRLRDDGVEVSLDQYESSPPQGWPLWMEHHIRVADFVLMVCTKSYFRKVMGQKEENGKGLGVKWEGNLIYQHIYNKGTENSRFIPILFEEDSPQTIPTPLQGATYYRIETKEGFEDLYCRITRQPRIIKPPLGKIKSYPPKELIKNNPQIENSRAISKIKKSASSSIHLEEVQCRFCGGSGADNPLFGRFCPICDGKGENNIKLSNKEELAECPSCNGTGEDNPLFGRFCPVCEGIGLNVIKKSARDCKRCGGTGANNPLFGRFCPDCKGTGYSDK
jgi:Zn finger protein HypA/HybF involved in hydrogenase expression